MLKTIIIILVFVSAISCVKSSYTVDSWIGMNEENVIKLLGKPTFEKMLLIDKNTRLYEYQSSLYKIFPDLGGNTVVVKELQWKYNYKTVAIWLHKNKDTWTVIDNLIWYQNLRF